MRGLAVIGALLAVCAAAGVARAGGREEAQRERGLERLERARARALALIFDRATYRDEDHGRSGQGAVDQAVELVRLAYAPVRAWLDADAARLEKSAAQREALLAADLEALGPWQRALRQHCLDRRVLRENEAVRRPPHGEAPGPAEREQVRHTNEYRLQLGRPALAIDGRLVASARGHSQEMRRLDYFAHESPTDGRRSVDERVALAGLGRVPVGENIAKGYRTPRAAFEGWYRSAGHHRNMLGDWTHMGAGCDGDLWTQNFATPAAG